MEIVLTRMNLNEGSHCRIFLSTAGFPASSNGYEARDDLLVTNAASSP